MKTALILALAVFGVASAIEFQRPCRSLPAHPNFNLGEYAGNWYELKRYDTTLQENGRCSTFDYYHDFSSPNPTQLEVTVRWSYVDNSELYHYGDAVLAAGQTDGRMTVTWRHNPTAPINYQILATDYENYSIVWDCQELGPNLSNEDAWVLSKAQELNPDVQDEVDAIIAQYLTEGSLQDTYQGPNCLIIGD